MLDKLLAIVDRLSADAGFRTQVQEQPEVALASYQLSTEEKSALKAMLEKNQNFVKPLSRFWL